jgi:hypothetical protein
MTHPGALDEAPADPVQPFRDWQEACARLRAAETLGGDYSDIVRLSAEVIRTRNALTLDQVRAGWSAPDDILRHLTLDERLLREKDDAERWPAAYANRGNPSAASTIS